MQLSKGACLLSTLLIVLLCYFSFFVELGGYGLWDPDEGRSGVIAKEMAVSGNWRTLTQNGAPYYDKPALYFWLVALVFRFFGLTEFAVRLPSAVAASLTVAVVFLWGCFSGGVRRGLWAALVLGSAAQFVSLARLGKMDMLFSFFVTAALFSFLWWRKNAQRDGPLWAFYLFVSFATLTKGPAGIILPLLVIFGFTVLTRTWHLLREMRWLGGLGLILLVAGPWYGLAATDDPQYIKTFLWEHNFLRYFAADAEYHPEPIYYLLPILIGGFLPWTFLLPAMIHRLWKHKDETMREERLFLVVWVLTVLVFFSLSQNKLGTYILPLFPALAMLTGDFLRQSLDPKENSSWYVPWILGSGMLWLFALLLLAPLTEMILNGHHPQYLPLNPSWLPAAFLILLLAVSWVLGQKSWSVWIVCISSIWLVVWFYEEKAKEIATLKSTRSFSQMLKRHTSKDVRVVAIGAESLAFYLPDRVEFVGQIGRVEQMLKEPIPTVAVVKEKRIAQMHSISPSRLFIWKRIPSANALVANFPYDAWNHPGD